MSNLEQRVIIKFFFDEGLSPDSIQSKLYQHFGDQAYAISTIKKWITRFKWGKEDFEDEPRSGRPKDDQIEFKIRKVIAEDPFFTCRSVALTLGVSDWLVRDRLHGPLGMKCMNLKYVPNFLTSEQKKNRITFSKQMLSVLEKHVDTQFKYIFTGDESWFLYHYEPATQWVATSADLGEKLIPKKIEKKIMMTVFLNGEGIQLVVFKKPDETIDSDYFIEKIIKPLDSKCKADPAPDGLDYMIHFDNAKSHVSQKTQSFLATTCFEKMKHPCYSPDLAPCDFGLFGTVKNKLIGIQCETEEELQGEIERVLGEFSPDEINRIFIGWMNRLRMCIQLDGEYIQ